MSGLKDSLLEKSLCDLHASPCADAKPKLYFLLPYPCGTYHLLLYFLSGITKSVDLPRVNIQGLPALWLTGRQPSCHPYQKMQPNASGWLNGDLVNPGQVHYYEPEVSLRISLTIKHSCFPRSFPQDCYTVLSSIPLLFIHLWTTSLTTAFPLISLPSPFMSGVPQGSNKCIQW